MQSNAYTIGFAAIVTIICSLLLSGVSGALKEKQDENRLVDRQKNILAALGVPTPTGSGEDVVSSADQLKELTPSAVQELYMKRVQENVVDGSGKVMDGKTPNDLSPKIASGEEFDPAAGQVVYSLRDEADASKTLAYAYPVTGKGLWSTLYGYLAVKPDGDEIIGLSFYKHGETPGLGANIEAPWFLNNFVGKHLYKEGKLHGVKVVKGKAADQVAADDEKANHMVDGMSGATITGNGVSDMMKAKPARYESFFASVRKGGGMAKAAPVPKTVPPTSGIEGHADWKPLENASLARFDVGGKSEEAVAVEAQIQALLAQGALEFDSGKAMLKSTSQKVLEPIIPILKEHDHLLVRIDGHTDNTGNSEGNHALAGKRAESVKQYLGTHGVESSRIFTYGFGEERPVADNATQEGRQNNRRIEFKTVLVQDDELKSLQNPLSPPGVTK